MPYTVETEGREDCPVTGAHCEHYAYQCDCNGEVAIDHCCHPHNPDDVEGNTRKELCPLRDSTTEEYCVGSENYGAGFE